MKEELLHFVWQSKLLLSQSLTTTSGLPVTIVQPGNRNANAGPDFFNARLQIGDTLWAGNIEIHISSSDWDRHRHTSDEAYNNVILHVVYVHDREVLNAQGEQIPTLELRSFLPTSLLPRYNQLQQQRETQLACQKILVHPPEAILSSWLQRLLVDRMEAKCDSIKDLLTRTHHHYEQTFYLLTARYFGMKVNAQPFEQLASELPLLVLTKHKNRFEDILALVIGTSGLFAQFDEPEIKSLEATYKHLANKYNLNSLEASVWKFGRTRPANFPTHRLLQFAALIYQSSHLLGKILECETVIDLRKLYQMNQSWCGHSITLGEDAMNLLLINSVLPFVFEYGKQQHRDDYCEKALGWYEQLPPESNHITKQYTALGLPLKNAGDSQAYIQLKNEYCIPLKCLECSIGYRSLLHQ
jgi:hypothetical protein